MTWTYDANLAQDGGLNQMRFELGDVLMGEAEKSGYLPDEEIMSVLNAAKSFRHAKLKLLETLLMRFSYEVDTKIAEAEWKLSERISQWERMYARLKGEISAEESGGLSAYVSGKRMREAVFRIGLHDYK